MTAGRWQLVGRWSAEVEVEASGGPHAAHSCPERRGMPQGAGSPALSAGSPPCMQPMSGRVHKRPVDGPSLASSSGGRNGVHTEAETGMLDLYARRGVHRRVVRPRVALPAWPWSGDPPDGSTGGGTASG